jgi:polyisoprenyl-teichoic acid--peptidoglycan teichoic acid transferase
VEDTNDSSQRRSRSRRNSNGRMSRAEAGRRRRMWRRLRLIVATTLLALIGSAAAWAGYTYWNLTERIKPPSEDAEAIAAALAPREASKSATRDPVWILLLGSDARPGESNARADSIILTRLDPESKTVTMLSIPRDTRVEIPGHGTTKINAATAYGGSALMIRTVSEFTGLPVDHYVKIDFEGFQEGVDAMGGILIDVEASIYDPQAADYVRSAARIEQGSQLLDGAKALTFVRSRAFPDGDFSRMRNQQTFMIEFLRQSLDQSKITQLPGVASSIASHLDTDMSVRELLDLAQTFKGLGPQDMQGYTIPSSTGMIGGVSYVLPDEIALKELAAAIEAGESPEAASDYGDALDFEVAVINATEVPRAAARLGNRLEHMGLTVTALMSDTTAAQGRSVVFYRGDEHVEEATLVAHALGDWPVEKNLTAVSRHADVVVVIGPSRVHEPFRQTLEH